MMNGELKIKKKTLLISLLLLALAITATILFITNKPDSSSGEIIALNGEFGSEEEKLDSDFYLDVPGEKKGKMNILEVDPHDDSIVLESEDEPIIPEGDMTLID